MERLKESDEQILFEGTLDLFVFVDVAAHAYVAYGLHDEAQDD